MISLFLGLLGMAIMVAVLILFAVHFIPASGTVWQRSLTAANQSAVHLWSFFNLVLGGLVMLLSNAALYFGDPSLSAAIQQVLSPQIVGIFIVVAALITIWARNRTLSK